MSLSVCRGWSLALLVSVLSLPAVRGATPESLSRSSPGETVDLFAARDEGKIDVKLVVKSSAAATAIVTNKTNQPLNIKVPEALAGIPVLAQFGAPGGGGIFGNNGGGANNGGTQAVGGAPNGGRRGGGGNPGGGAVFNIGPEKVAKIKIDAVCLEHGKESPNPHVSYELVPAEAYTSDVRVTELLAMLSRGEIDQRPAQAAAWHFANGLSWQQLAEKVGTRHLNGHTELYFSSREIEQAQQAATTAARRAKQTNSPSLSPGEEVSLNRE